MAATEREGPDPSEVSAGAAAMARVMTPKRLAALKRNAQLPRPGAKGRERTQEERDKIAEGTRARWARQKAEGNAPRTGRALSPLSEIPCTCGAGDSLT